MTNPPRDFLCDDTWRNTPYVCIKCKRPLTVIRNTPYEKPYHGICAEGHCHWAFAGDCIRFPARKQYSLDSASFHSAAPPPPPPPDDAAWGSSSVTTARLFFRFLRSWASRSF